jgi:hypothetical protein
LLNKNTSETFCLKLLENANADGGIPNPADAFKAKICSGPSSILRKAAKCVHPKYLHVRSKCAAAAINSAGQG